MVEQLFGIDFGTTNSLASVVVGDEVRSLVNEQDNRPHPSVVWYRGTDVIVGREARKHLDTMQTAAAHGFVRSPKMALRRDGPLHVEGQTLDPTDVVAGVLRYLRENATARRPSLDLSKAVMTIPVDFGGAQRRALRNAARKAGIAVVQFVHEPAAALYAHLRAQRDVQRALAELENRNVLVFDWGGGTLDLNVCRIAGGTLYQISTRGNNEVGGDRFDERLRNLIRDKHAKQHVMEDITALEQAGASAALLTQCELAKIELSSKPTHTVLVRDYLRSAGPERNLAISLSRKELEVATQDIIDRGLGEIDAILEQSALDRQDIDRCLATGGMVNMPAVWDGLIERFGGRVPRLPNGDRIIAEGAAWIAHDGIRLTLAKPIEVVIADRSGRGAYLPIAMAGLKMPVENQSVTVSNRRFFCVDPRDGAAVFQFAKPRKAGLVQASDDRETICVGNLPIDSDARPLLERLECELQIDHDYIAHATLRSLGRNEIMQLEFHQLEFGLALPLHSATTRDNGPLKDEADAASDEPVSSETLAQQLQPNITLRSNLTPKGEDWRPDMNDWHVVPGDLVERWTTDFIGPRFDEMSAMQIEERNYYLPCVRCGRTLYSIRAEGPNEICRQYRCSEARREPMRPFLRAESPGSEETNGQL
jgi:actin-like ATPase involved in cell morphogenesis